MKHAKRMVLVEAPSDNENISKDENNRFDIRSKDPEQYTKSSKLFDLDNELKKTLSRNDLADREKWLIYNQILQRFLFFLNEERSKNKFDSTLRQQFHQAPSSTSVNRIKNIRETQNLIPRVMNFAPTLRENNDNRDVQEVDDSNTEDEFDYIRDGTFLTAHNSDLEDDNEDIIESRGTKRGSDENTNQKVKKKRDPSNPLYSYMYRPGLMRFKINSKEKVNKAKQNRLVKAYYEQKRKPQLRKRFAESDSIEDQLTIPLKRPKVVLDRSIVANFLKQQEQLGKGLNSLPIINSLQYKLCNNDCEKIVRWESF